MTAPAKNWTGVVLATGLDDQADIPAIAGSYYGIYRTLLLMVPTAEGDLLVGYRRLWYYNVPAPNYTDGDGVLLLVSRTGVVLDRHVINISGYNQAQLVWSAALQTVFASDAEFYNDFPNTVVQLWKARYSVHDHRITTDFETGQVAFTNPDWVYPVVQLTTPSLPGDMAAIDPVNRVVLGEGVYGNSIFGSGTQVFFKQLDLDTGELLAELVYELPSGDFYGAGSVNAAYLSPGRLRFQFSTRSLIVTGGRGTITVESDVVFRSSGYYTMGGIPTDETTLDIAPEFAPQPTYIHGSVSAPVTSATVFTPDGAYPIVADLIGNYIPANEQSQSHPSLLAETVTLYDAAHDLSRPGLYLFDKDALTSQSYRIENTPPVPDFSGYTSGAALCVDSDIFVVIAEPDGNWTASTAWGVVLYIAGGIPHYLRMTQRNDGLGIAGHPRLIGPGATNGASSTQLSSAPRVGEINTYT